MKIRVHNNRFSSRCRSKKHLPASRRSAREGYALLVLMIAVTVLLISLTAVLPDILTEGQRGKEEELVFRGNEYARAIALYHARFNRYPMKVDDLIKGMNGMKFLRHAYPDPMTKSGKWRFIHVNAAGVVVDSRLMKQLGPMGPGGMGTQGGAMGSGFGGRPEGGSSAFSSGFSLGPAGNSPGTMGPGSENPVNGAAAPGQESGQGFPSGAVPGQESGVNPEQGSAPTSTNSSSESGFGFSNQTAGLFIVGVASTSHKKSFRILNKQKYYDDWEFLGLPNTMNSGAMGMPGAAGIPPGGTGNPLGTSGSTPTGAFPPVLGNPTTNP